MYKVVFCIFFQLEISNIWTEEKNVMFSFTGLVLDALLQIRLEQSLKGLHLVVTRLHHQFKMEFWDLSQQQWISENP